MYLILYRLCKTRRLSIHWPTLHTVFNILVRSRSLQLLSIFRTKVARRFTMIHICNLTGNPKTCVKKASSYFPINICLTFAAYAPCLDVVTQLEPGSTPYIHPQCDPIH